MEPSHLTETLRTNSALRRAVRPQTAAPVRKGLSQGEVPKPGVYDRLYSAARRDRPQTASIKRNSFFNCINTDKRPLDFNSIYREPDLSLDSFRGQHSILGSKCPSFDAATFASMFPGTRPTSATTALAKQNRSLIGERSGSFVVATAVKPNLTINAYNLSKALQLVTKDKQIREEQADSDNERRLNEACRTKSIEKICRVSQSMTELRTMGMGRPMSAVKVASLARLKPRQISSVTSLSMLKDYTACSTLVSTVAANSQSRYAVKKVPSNMTSLLTVKTMPLNQPALKHKLSRSELISQSSKLRPSKSEAVKPVAIKKDLSGFTNQELKFKGELALNLGDKKPKHLLRVQTFSSLTASSRHRVHERSSAD
jgi:hypothetical protein